MKSLNGNYTNMKDKVHLYVDGMRIENHFLNWIKNSKPEVWDEYIEKVLDGSLLK